MRAGPVLRGSAALAAAGLIALLAGAGWAQVAVPALSARVSDLTGTLTREQAAALEERLMSFERAKGSQVGVLIVPTTEPETVEQFALRVVEQWRLGRKAIDDGVLLLVAKNDRRMRIEVGYGLEGALPDAIAKRIIAETITPLFRQGDYFGGISAGVEQILKVIQGEALPEPQAWHGEKEGVANGIVPFAIMALALGVFLGRLFGPAPGSLLGGLGFGVAVYALTAALLYGALAAIAMFFIVLLLSSARGLPAGIGHGRGGRPGGFGGGGFGGGGGGFGGGGASGGW